MKKKQITLTETQIEFLNKIKESNGLTTLSNAINYAIAFTYKKENPAYVEVARERIAKAPVDKAVEHVDKIDARKKAKQDKIDEAQKERVEAGRMIALNLRGEIYTDDRGEEKCRYYVYGWLNTKNAWVNEHTKYLDELTDTDVEQQYYNDSTNPKTPMPSDQVIATLVDLGITDNQGKPL